MYAMRQPYWAFVSQKGPAAHTHLRCSGWLPRSQCGSAAVKDQEAAPSPHLSFQAGLTCTVTTRILTTCSINLQGLRPLARNLSQGLMKKYLSRRRRSSSSGGVGGTGKVPDWVPYPALGVKSRSVSVESGESFKAWAALLATGSGQGVGYSLLLLPPNPCFCQGTTVRGLRKYRKSATFNGCMQQSFSQVQWHTPVTSATQEARQENQAT